MQQNIQSRGNEIGKFVVALYVNDESSHFITPLDDKGHNAWSNGKDGEDGRCLAEVLLLYKNYETALTAGKKTGRDFDIYKTSLHGDESVELVRQTRTLIHVRSNNGEDSYHVSENLEIALKQAKKYRTVQNHWYA